jgi:4-amino-4-deoxy-L-arabinose transferase-like glycosyltransferase
MPGKFAPWIIAAAGAAFFLPFLGAVHLFDWDEINFAESAREMLVTGNFTRVQIDYQPFWEKPPLFFWLQAISMHVFGVNEFAARLPNALFGISTLITFFLLGRKMYDQRFGTWWALAMLGSFLPHLYFKSGIIDPVFNYFIFLGVWFTARCFHHEPRSNRWAALAGFFIGLATLTKGPVALLILILTVTVYWMSIHFRKKIPLKQFLFFALTYALTAGIWFAIDVYENGIGFLGEFFRYQLDLFLNPVAGHGQPFYYHFVVVLIGCFPMSIIALPEVVKVHRESSPVDFRKWMLILFWVVLILFSVVKTKIVHYSSLTYFPLAFLAARVIHQPLAEGNKFPLWQSISLLVFGLIFSLLLFAVPWILEHQELLIPYLNDPFAVDSLSVEVAWLGYESWIGIAYAIAVIAAVVLLFRKKIQHGVVTLFLATAVCLLIYLKAVVPKIEHYSQAPAIEFYESLQGEKVYVATFGFKSYAQYFYFRQPPGQREESRQIDWLLTGDIDRPVYFVAKTTSMKELESKHELKFLYRKGGFAFYKREE